MWFLVALFGYFILACIIVIDKKIVSGTKLPAAVYTLYSTLPAGLFFLAYPFFGAPKGGDMLLALGSGIAFGAALWFLFMALEENEAIHIGPFGGAMIAVTAALFSAFFLGERLSSGQRAGVLLLVMAALLLSGQIIREGSWRRGFLWAFFSAVCFAASHVSAKYLYGLYSFPTVLVWTKGSIGIVGILALMFPGVWHSVHRQFAKKHGKHDAKRHPIGLVVMDKFLGFLGEMCIQYAILLGSVTLVNALIGIQYVFLFLLIVLLTRFAPRVFHEQVTRREYAVQAIAILLIAAGSFFFVV